MITPTTLDAKLFRRFNNPTKHDKLRFLRPIKEVTLFGDKGAVHVLFARIYPTYKYIVMARIDKEEPVIIFCGKVEQANAEFVKYCE